METRVAEVQGVTISFTLLSVLAVALRSFTRIRVVHAFGLDDACMVAAACLTVFLGTTSLVMTQHGLGRHYADVPPGELPVFGKWNWYASLTYSPEMALVKLSILVFYLRISPKPWLRNCCFVAMFITIGVGAASFFVILLQCSPNILGVYNGTATKCLPMLPFYYWNAGMNMGLDFGIYILPLPIVMGLSIPRRQRFGLLAIFSIGALAVIISIVRLATLPAVVKSTDPTWDQVLPIDWSVIEINLMILASCIPSFKAFVRTYMPGFLSSTGGPSEYQRNNGQVYAANTNSYHMSAVGGGQKKPRRQQHPLSLDNDSEELILDGKSHGKNPGILRTLDVTQTVEQGGGEHSVDTLSDRSSRRPSAS